MFDVGFRKYFWTQVSSFLSFPHSRAARNYRDADSRPRTFDELRGAVLLSCCSPAEVGPVLVSLAPVLVVSVAQSAIAGRLTTSASRFSLAIVSRRSWATTPGVVCAGAARVAPAVIAGRVAAFAGAALRYPVGAWSRDPLCFNAGACAAARPVLGQTRS